MTARVFNRVSTVVLALLLLGLSKRSQAVQDTNAFTDALTDRGASNFTARHNVHGSILGSAGDTGNGTAERSQQQSCTNGVSTYSSSRLHESLLKKEPVTGKHKPLWPLDRRDWWTFAVATLAIFVAAGGGIGGGGVLVPLYASVLGKHPLHPGRPTNVSLDLTAAFE